MKLTKLAKILPVIAALALGILGPSLALTHPSYASEYDICENNNIPEEIRGASGCADAPQPADLPAVVVSIINGVIGVVSIVAVIAIVYAGINYITSAGDAAKIEKAKRTILYALIGLVVCALSFAIVNFAITNIIGGGSSGDASSSETTDSSDNSSSSSSSSSSSTNSSSSSSSNSSSSSSSNSSGSRNSRHR